MTQQTRGFELTFAGEWALVTGAASGIGAATVQRLVASGISVLAIDIALSAPVQIGNVCSIPLVADVRSREQLEKAVGEVGRAPDYVVNCAGILDSTGFHSVDAASFARVLDINLVGAYNVIDVSHALGNLRSVVNITSIEATRVIALSDPDPHPAYAASKAGLRMLTKTASRALSQFGVRVNSVAPGFVLTPMAKEHASSSDSLPPALESRVPLQRFAEPHEIANSIAFLLSDQASYITGTELTIDGGFSQT